MDGVMRALAKEKTQWKEGRLVLSGEVSSTEDVKILSLIDSNDGHASDIRTQPRSFPEVAIVQKVWKGMDINPKDETSYTTQYQEAFLKYVENEYCAKHRRVPVNNSKPYRTAISTPPQRLQGPINHPLIHMIRPAMMRNT